MSRFIDFLRRIFRIKSPSLHKGEQYTYYKPPEWKRIRQQLLDNPAPCTTALGAIDHADALTHAAGQAGKAIGCDLAAGLERPPAVLYANDKPFVTIQPDAIDVFHYALRRMSEAAAEAAATLNTVAHAVIDADLIGRYGTAKEIHYITHGRKAHTRKKYRNRVLRRAHRTERRKSHEYQTHRT